MANTYKGYGLTPQGDAVPFSGGSTPASVLEAENAQKLGNVPAGDYALKTDTVANAEKLAGHPASYYLPVRNLLINPDFAIAQAGYNSLHGDAYFCADRWNGSNNEITLSKNVGYITLTSTADYRQIYQKILVSDLVSDEYTFAVTRRSASVASSLYLYGENANGNATSIKSVSMSKGDEWQTFVLNFTRAEVAQYTKIWCCIRNQATGAADYKEPGLYPGTYTAKTLPPYVPKGYAAELLACEVAEKTSIFEWKHVGTAYAEAVTVPKCSEVLLFLQSNSGSKYSFASTVIQYSDFETAYIPLRVYINGGEANILCNRGTVSISSATMGGTDVKSTSSVAISVR